MNKTDRNLQHSLKTSASLIGDLFKETQFIRNRHNKINEALLSCGNNNLSRRLKQETFDLNKRKVEIQKLAKILKKYNLKDQLSIDLLIELTSRSIKTI